MTAWAAPSQRRTLIAKRDHRMSLRARQPIPTFPAEQLEAIARTLAAADDGLTGSEIAQLLASCHIPDPDPSNTKWKRLYTAFAAFQNTHRVGNHVVLFINRAMSPVRYTNDPGCFSRKRAQLNAVLAFSGITIAQDGTARRVDHAKSLDEALERANRMAAHLRSRGVHGEVLRFCNAEILAQNYFHAVFEALKSISARLRAMSGLDLDGAALVESSLGLSDQRPPLIALNPLRTRTDHSEQRGFASILTGLFGAIRNPLAHEARIEWEMTEEDALDVLTLLSLVHRKLDKAQSRIAPLED